MEKITKELYIGGVTTKADVEHHKIQYVVNLVGLKASYRSKMFPIKDSGFHNDPVQFLRIIQAIDKHVKRRKTPIFIQCAMGMSRSPIVCALYLYYDQRFGSFDEAMEFVESMSRVAKPNPSLIEFVKMKVVPLAVKKKRMIRHGEIR